MQAGTQLRSSKALARPGCSCTKVLISSCPRLGAEHALGICHEVAGNFAIAAGRAGQEEGAAPAVLFIVPSPELEPRRQGEAYQIAAASMVQNVTLRTPPGPQLSGLGSWLALEPAAVSMLPLELSLVVVLTTHSQYTVDSQTTHEGQGPGANQPSPSSSEKLPRTPCCLGSYLFCSLAPLGSTLWNSGLCGQQAKAPQVSPGAEAPTLEGIGGDSRRQRQGQESPA